MSNTTTPPLIRTMMGAAMGFFLHTVLLGVALVIITIVAVVADPTKTFEGLFWGSLVILFFSPGGVIVGALTGLASKPSRVWTRAALFGAVLAALLGLFAALSFSMFSQGGPKFGIGGAVGVTGMLVAAIIARVNHDPPREDAPRT